MDTLSDLHAYCSSIRQFSDAAYSSLVPVNRTHIFVVYERAGYATITGRIVELRL